MIWLLMIMITVAMIAGLIYVIYDVFWHNNSKRANCGMWIYTNSSSISVSKKQVDVAIAKLVTSMVILTGYSKDKINNHLRKIHCIWCKPKIVYMGSEQVKWPSVLDNLYLARRRELCLPEPTKRELEKKLLRGEYDPWSGKFYCSGRVDNPRRIVLTWYGDVESSEFIHMVTLALLWQFESKDVFTVESSTANKIMEACR